MTELIFSYLLALIVTLIIESLIIFPCFRSHCDNLRKLAINFLLINAITNLSLNILVGIFGVSTFALLLELIIPLVEARMFRYAGVTGKRRFIVIICYIANLLSFAIGYYLFVAVAFATRPSSSLLNNDIL